MSGAARIGLRVALLASLPFLWLVIASLTLLAGTRLWGNPAIPPQAYPWQWLVYAPHFGHHALVSVWLVVGAMMGALPLFPAVRWVSGSAKQQNLHGESHFLSRFEAIHAGFAFSLKPRPDALVLGRWGIFYVSLPGEEHAALYARTRSGKGIGFVNPNAMSWGGALLAFSIKRDIVRETAAARQALGDTVYVFDITSPDSRTHRWNPLGLVRRGTVDAHGDIQRAMFGIVPQTKANNPYWDNAARRIAVAAGVLISETSDAKLNVNEVRKLIGSADYDERIRKMIRDARVAKRPYPEAAVNTLLTWLDRKKEEGAASVRETLTTAMQLWEDPRIQAATETSDFDLSRIRSERMAIYVCAEPGDIRRLQLIYGLFFDQFVAVNTRQEYKEDPSHIHRVLVELDEFWALGKRDVLADAVAFTASFGFRLAYVLQSKSQVRTIFGDEGSKNLFLNTGVECLFGGTDQDTAKEVSERAGFDTVQERTQNRPKFMAWLNWSKQSESEAARRRALMLPQEISRIPKDTMIVLRPGFMPLRIKRIVHYADPHYEPLIGKAPLPPLLRITVEYDDAAGALAKEQTEQQAALDAIRARQEQAKAEEAAEAEVKLAEITRAAADAQMTAQAAAQVEAMAEAESKQAAKDAAAAMEAARLARAEATEATAAARKAKATLDSAIALGPPPPWISGAVPPAEARAATATEAARVASEVAAEATEAARVARAGLTAAGRDAKKARAKAEKLTHYLAIRGGKAA